MDLNESESAVDLAQVLSEHATTLHEAQTVDQTLLGITQAAIETIPGAEAASITIVTERSKLETRGATSSFVNDIDQAQYDTGEGPCLSALWESPVVRADDIETDGRWPDWAKRVKALDVGSMLCFQLYVRGDALGALNTFATRPHSYEGDAESIGALFAVHAAIALSGAEEAAQLRQAASSRDLIGQAKGILMERYDFDSDSEAFDLLVRASQGAHLKLHEVARQVVERRREFRTS